MQLQRVTLANLQKVWTVWTVSPQDLPAEWRWKEECGETELPVADHMRVGVILFPGNVTILRRDQNQAVLKVSFSF